MKRAKIRIIVAPEKVPSAAERGGSMSLEPKTQCEWELNWKKNPVQAYFNTVKSVIKRPIRYFGEIKPFENFVSLAVFVYINCFVALFFNLIFQGMFLGLKTGGMAVIPFSLCWMIFLPIVAVGFTFMMGGILHLFFHWFGGNTDPCRYTRHKRE